MEEGGAWINIAEILHLVRPHRGGARGRAPGARGRAHARLAHGGLAAAGRSRSSASTWATGPRPERDPGAEPPAHRRHAPLLADVAGPSSRSGAATLELADEALAALGEAAETSTEPQFIGAVRRPARGAGAPPRRSRRRARRAWTTRSTGSSTAPRTSCGSRRSRPPACASRATPARARATAATPRPARRSATRADALLERARLAAESGWVVEAAQLATAEAEHARATGEGPRAAATRRRSGRRRPRLWDDIPRPYPAAYCRWREAEALMAARDRDGATRAASLALTGARRLGSAWLVEEVESLAARARLQLGEERGGAAAAAAAGGRGPVRPDRARARRARARGRGRHEPRDRRAAPHGREDGQRPRVAHPREAERALPHRGRRGCAPAGPGTNHLMRALVTGATGFIGGRLADALAARGVAVRSARPGPRPSGGSRGRGARAARGRRARRREPARRRGGRVHRLLPRPLHGARQRGRRLRGARAQGGGQLRAHGEGRGRRAGGLPRRARRRALRAPEEPRRDRRDAGGRGTAARVLPRRDGDRRGERVVPDAALPRGAPAGDDRAEPGCATGPSRSPSTTCSSTSRRRRSARRPPAARSRSAAPT